MSTYSGQHNKSTRLGALLVASLLGTGVFLAAPTHVFAQTEEVNRQVEELSEQAFERYSEKDYEGAIALFEQAYELHPVPNLLYNMARCYEKKQEWDEAIDHYEQFIVAPDIDTDDRKSALERIEKLREIQDAQKDIEQDPDKKDPDKGDVVQPPVVEEKGPSKVPGAVLLGVGIAALGTGGYFGLQASGTQEEFDAAQDTATKRDLQQRGQRQALIADGLYIGGAAFSILGTVLLVRASKKSESTSLEQKKSSNAPSVTYLSPSFGKGYGGLSMGLSF